MASQNLRAAIVFAISMAATVAAESAGASDLLVRAYGPVDRVGPNGSLSVLGSTFEIAPNADAVVDGQHFPHAASALGMLSLGTIPSVAVLSDGADAPVTRIVVNFNKPYVPGASQVVTTGVVRAIDPRVARLWIGKTIVDYSAVLSDTPEFAVHVGDVVQVLGTKPSNSSPILAARAQIIPRTAPAAGLGLPGAALASGISGSGTPAATAHGISGSGAPRSSGISGSGAPVHSSGISGSGNPEK